MKSHLMDDLKSLFLQIDSQGTSATPSKVRNSMVFEHQAIIFPADRFSEFLLKLLQSAHVFPRHVRDSREPLSARSRLHEVEGQGEVRHAYGVEGTQREVDSSRTEKYLNIFEMRPTCFLWFMIIVYLVYWRINMFLSRARVKSDMFTESRGLRDRSIAAGLKNWM